MSEMPTPTRDILEAWFSQAPTFALMGEFSAGKSTLLNLLLGGEVLLTQVTATNMPVVWMTYAETPQAHALARDGTLEPFEIDALRDASHKDKLLLRLGLPLDILKRADIIDTPGISDPRLALGALEFLGPYLDFVVWCSAANQAWRQTEKAMWTSLPLPLRDNSVMALTRADTMRKKADLKKVIRRCETEAADLFRDFAPIATLSALQARGPTGDVTDPAQWDASHADAFFETLDISIARATEACAQRTTRQIPQSQKVEAVVPVEPKTPAAPTKPKRAPKAAPKKKAKPAAPKAKVKKTATPKPSIATISELSAQIAQLCQPDVTASSNDQFFTTLDHLFTTFLCETQLSDAHQTVVSRMMSLQRNGAVPQQKVIVQLIRELDDFAETPWCTLDQIH